MYDPRKKIRCTRNESTKFPKKQRTFQGGFVLADPAGCVRRALGRAAEATYKRTHVLRVLRLRGASTRTPYPPPRLYLRMNLKLKVQTKLENESRAQEVIAVCHHYCIPIAMIGLCVFIPH